MVLQFKGIVWILFALLHPINSTHEIQSCAITDEQQVQGNSMLQKQFSKATALEPMHAEFPMPLTAEQPFAEEDFVGIQRECCLDSFDSYSRGLLVKLGMEICDEGCHNGFIPFFYCGQVDTLQKFVNHILQKSREECACYALMGQCALGGLPLACLQNNEGQFKPTWHRRRSCQKSTLPDMANATCDIYVTCTGDTPVNKGSKVQCPGGASSCDASTCCEARATCDTFSSCSGATPVNKGNEVQCSGNAASCDASSCCEARATCDRFSSCTSSNRGSQVQCSGNSASCDASTCCEAKATCDSFPSCSGSTPVNKGSEVQCSGNSASCDTSTCCEARATCNSFFCIGETPVNKGSDVQCSGDSASCDANTCCEARATCEKFSACSGSTPVNRGSEVQCSGDSASCDAISCCEARAPCDSFSSCSGDTPVNKGNQVQCSGNSASCDASTCCEAKATCDSFSSCSHDTPVNKGSQVQCSGNSASCDANTCCEAKATCDRFSSCSGDTPVNKGSQVQCSGNSASCDAITCCEAKATCDSFPSCSGDTPVNKGSQVQCSGNSASCDAITCCEARSTCDSFPSCSGDTPVNKGSEVECSGNFASCNANTCCEARATCDSFSACGGDTPVNKGSGVHCSGDSASCDASICCETRATCDTFPSCSGSTPVNKGNEVQCSGNASSCDTGTCCEPRGRCGIFSCSGDAPVNKGRWVPCSGADSSCDASTCCQPTLTEDELKTLAPDLQNCESDLVLQARDLCTQAMQSDPVVLDDWFVLCLTEICNAGIGNASKVAQRYDTSGDPTDVCSEDMQAYAASACHKEMSENCTSSTEWVKSCVEDVCAAEKAGMPDPLDTVQGYCDAQLQLKELQNSFRSLLPPDTSETKLEEGTSTTTLAPDGLTTKTTTQALPLPRTEESYVMAAPSVSCPNGMSGFAAWGTCCCDYGCCWDSCRISPRPIANCFVENAQHATWRPSPIPGKGYYAALKIYPWLVAPTAASDELECNTWTDSVNECAIPASQEQCSAFHSSLPQADQESSSFHVLEVGADRASSKPHGCLQSMTPGIGVAVLYNKDAGGDAGYDWIKDGVLKKLCCGEKVLRQTTTTTTAWARNLGPESAGSLPPLRPYSAPASSDPISVDRPQNAVFGICSVWGDPHIIPFDHSGSLDMYSQGSFWLVSSESVWIQGFYAPASRHSPAFPNLRAVAVGGPFLQGNTLMIDPMTIWWNEERPLGEFSTEKKTWKGLAGTVIVSEQSMVVMGKPHMSRIEVSLPHDVSLVIQINHMVLIKDSLPRFTLGIAMRQIVGQDGHCGNFNGNAADDSVAQVKQRFGRQVGSQKLLIPY